MENSSNLWRKLIRFCVGATSLVLAVVFLYCQQQRSPQVTITFTKTAGAIVSTYTPPGASLKHGNRDSLEWKNQSGTDLLVCMYEPDLNGRAFVPTSFDVPNTKSVLAHVRKGARPTISGKYEHEFYTYDALAAGGVDDCPLVPPTVQSGMVVPPRTIIVR